jgi:fatty acid-binding protein DegV
VLDIKPILTIESEMKAVERVRTRKRGLERLVELMLQRRAVAGADRWFVQHTGAHEDAQRLADRLTGVFGTEPEFVWPVGPVVATHLGPEALLAGGLSGTALGGGGG